MNLTATERKCIMSITKILGMFDKLDDIIYEPIRTICHWAEEPLRKKEAERARAKAEHDFKLEKQRNEEELIKNRKFAEIDADVRRWNAEIDDFISRQEIERNKKILDAITEYRRSMIEDAIHIAANLSEMEIDLAEKAHDLVLRKTEEYKRIQDDSIKKCDERLQEIQERYANNERVRIRMEDMVIDQSTSIIEAATKFIQELEEDIRRINIANSNRIDKATEFTEELLTKWGTSLGIPASTSFNTGAYIEQKNKALLQKK